MKIISLTALFVLVLVPVLSAADPAPTEVLQFTKAKVDDAFAKGLPLAVNESYKVQAGRRIVAPGAVEVHEHDTDIFYVTEGAATIVTGGTAEGMKASAAGEIRGEKITGGVTRHLVKGDVIVIPKGVPHWFTEVSNPFLYLVVKVTQ